MKMKRYSITGWWNQPNYQTLAIVKDRAGVVRINNSHAFSGILTVHEDGRINDGASVLIDKNGIAMVTKAKIDFQDGTISFDKIYERRTDAISYQASYDKIESIWRGTFGGEATGRGTTSFAIQELPDALFVEDED